MFGGGSIQLARVFGIRIGLHPSWFLVLFLIIWSLSGSYADLLGGGDGEAFVLATASALLLFASVLLHELGHALVAMRNGIGIAGIDLWLFGGLARMKRDTGSAGVELRVAAAGPLVTLAITLACLAAGLLIAGGERFADAARFDENAGVRAPEALLAYVTTVNGLLLVFNLIPGFPLDGGRIVRAIAWWRTGDRAVATRFAARLGRGFAYVLIGLGIFAFLNGWLVYGAWFAFIGIFLGQAARAAELETRISARLGGLRVEDVMDAEPVTVSTETRLDRALEEFFLRYRWQSFPVVDRSGRFVGVLSRDRVDAVPEALRAGSRVDEVMTREPAGAMTVEVDAPLEALLTLDRLPRTGFIMAVDREGMLRGVVTMEDVRRALQAAPQPGAT